MRTRPTRYHHAARLLWLFPAWVEAVTLGRHIFFRAQLPPAWLVEHEKVHVEQFRRHGLLGFFWIYLVREWRLPYRQKSFERAAYAVSSPPITPRPGQ